MPHESEAMVNLLKTDETKKFMYLYCRDVGAILIYRVHYSFRSIIFMVKTQDKGVFLVVEVTVIHNSLNFDPYVS